MFSRSEAKSRVKELDGQVVSSVSKKVTHVVCGEKAGSKKKKAEELGLNIISEKEFSDLISGIAVNTTSGIAFNTTTGRRPR